ncbi:TetR/AcrR family transcriptional regulator [Gordonia rubripertincta]|uniref:TetR/AcrR family transcriptional regulator n=1 Tax=Gordonia rubripertincta TaxID=36822 RepID=UPI000B8D8305|nr:TetR/AcrR family transcriptional regulator [Gordonia rubripertincta]ASR01199.1 HTH-type transcriptional regulator EthR [Gordonia rubripertincta]
MTSESTEAKRMSATDRREQILSCAMKLFEKRPYSEVSTSDIADEAGIRRPLIHHYFGTKRELYLEVVRRLSYVPAVAVAGVRGDTLDERIDSSIARWLDVAWRHRNLWVSTITLESAGADTEVAQILREADKIAADRMLEAIGLKDGSAQSEKLHTILLAYGALAKSASRLWLVDSAMTRAEVQALLTATLRAIVRDVVGMA